ncbi:MAG: efflux RND transporter periplasmic adaptor subunit [Patescibacteria group bacterium]|jgi:HlyD family secretion protein
MRLPKLNKKLIILIVIIILAIGGFIISRRPQKLQFESMAVSKQNIIQEVSVTGHIKPVETVDLAFEKNGKVTEANIKIGDKIEKGKILVKLDNTEVLTELRQNQANLESAQAQLNQYQAALDSQKSKLTEMESGTRIEEIQVQEIKVANAKISLANAKNDLIDKLKDAYTKSDDSIKNKIDQMFDKPTSADPQFNFSLNNFSLEINLEQDRISIENMLTDWDDSLGEISASSDFDIYLSQAEKNLDQINSFLEQIANVVNGLTPAMSGLSQTTIDTHKSNTSIARTNMNTAVVNLSAAKEGFEAAQSSLNLAEQELILSKAGTVKEQIDSQKFQVKQAEANVVSQQAKINQAEASVENTRVQMEKLILRSPIAGIVTKQEAKVGEFVTANTVMVGIMSDKNFEIETNIPEADIAKVKIGNLANVTLDAYGSSVILQAELVKIDPAETMIEGVSTYKTNFQFKNEDERIKPGMTANIDIIAAQHDNVITVPQRAITDKDGKKIVKIVDGDGFKEVEVETGMRGSEGEIEILKGLNEGDKVITSQK